MEIIQENPIFTSDMNDKWYLEVQDNAKDLDAKDNDIYKSMFIIGYSINI